MNDLRGRRKPWGRRSSGDKTRLADSAFVIGLLLIAGLSPVHAQDNGGLRDRIRERLEARRAQTVASSSPASIPAGTHEYSLEHQGLRRKYLVHVPKLYDATRPAALVLAFHGGGGDAAHMADEERYGLVSTSEQAGFVIVFPNGYSRLPRGKLATWNAGTCCGDARDRNVDDVGFVRAMLAAIKKRISVDPGRIFATGMSNGGMLSHRLACDMADEFAAVAAVAGTDNTRQCTPSRPVAVLHIHARDDDHVLFSGGAGDGAFRDGRKVTEFTSVPETIARWNTRNRCGTTAARTLERPGAWCDSYSGCAAGVHVQLCVTETGGHSWPGAGKVRWGKAVASQALGANAVMWEFFQANGRERGTTR